MVDHSLTSQVFMVNNEEITAAKISNVDDDDEEKTTVTDKASNDPCIEEENISDAKKRSKLTTFRWRDIKWHNVALLTVLHVLAYYGATLFVSGACKWQSSIVSLFFGTLSGIGITAGAHRLWAHRSYKATFPLRLFLAFCNCVALQTDIYDWCRDHRVHHRYSETDADPHNSSRGLFFSHMGWLMLPKHKEVLEKGKKVDLSDVWADPIVRFQRRFYIPLGLLCWGVLPTLTAVYLCNERPLYAFLYCVILRYVYILHTTWNVNSFAHYFGSRPYTIAIAPRENKSVTYLALGEGYHNYHHTFPWDYSASEHGVSYNYNITTLFINLCAKLGLAYDLRKPTGEMIVNRIRKHGPTLAKYDHTMNEPSKLYTLTDWFWGMFIFLFPTTLSLSLRYYYACPYSS